MFSTLSEANPTFSATLILSSANAFNSEFSIGENADLPEAAFLSLFNNVSESCLP